MLYILTLGFHYSDQTNCYRVKHSFTLMIPIYTDLFPYYSFDATRYLLVNGIAILNIKGGEKYVIFAQERKFADARPLAPRLMQ